MNNTSRQRQNVIGIQIDILDWQTALARISDWSRQRESRYVCICNVHSIVTASTDPDFGRVVESADMATPDGAPVAWLMRKLGAKEQSRINGPDLMWKYCKLAAQNSESIFLYGGTPATLEILQRRLEHEFPGLIIAGAESPPFRPLSQREDADVVERINSSNASTVWVSLGCPKQETWMAIHRGRINSVMIGVGAAFDYHAGRIRRAPLWMQNNGLEWLYRVCSEPRRLWRRYLTTNTHFIILAAKQLIRKKSQMDR